jgi:hypothetical protein
MKLAGLLVTVAALAASVATLAAAQGTTRPTLRLTDASPVVLRGSGFEARERVRVSVYAGERAAKRATAGLRGGFVVRFDVDASLCAGFSAVAVGSKSSRASFKRPPGMCPQP